MDSTAYSHNGNGVARISKPVGLLPGLVKPDSRTVRRTVLVIDRSPSMDATDWPPTRIQAAICCALEYVDASAAANPMNEATIIAFSGDGSLVLPFTPCSLRLNFEQALKAIVSDSDTNISAGLSLAEQQIVDLDNEPNQEILVHLLTDGEHNVGEDPRRVAESLKRLGLAIDVVGIGGNPAAVNEVLLKELASEHPDGGKRYRFIGDPRRLTEHYKKLAGRLTL